MAFFSKLKDRLFRSSSKLEEGLDAIVQDGGEIEEAVATPEPTPPAPVPAPEAPEPIPTPMPPVETPPAPVETPPSSSEETPSAPDETPPSAPDETPAPAPVETPHAPDETPAPAPVETPHAPDETPPPMPVETPPAPDQTPPPAPVETPPAPDQTPPPVPVETPPSAPLEVPIAPPVEQQAAPVPAAASSARPKGILNRILGRDTKADTAKSPPQPAAPADRKPVTRRVLDDDMVEQLEELLIASDMGVETALRVAANLAEGRMGRRISTDEIKSLLSAEIAAIMEPVARPMPLYPKKPQVVLVVGVNGSGKTTTIGKLASQFREAGKTVIIAAGDTFRAAAVEQLEIWGDRAGVPVMKAVQGSDPASLAFDAMVRAESEGADLLLIDTAGRLQNRADLMEELSKIVRVIRKKDPTAPHNTLLVLDATTGQNALSQVETFQKLADVSGLIMTKLDGTAKGGVLVALADKFGLPIHAIGVGEQIDDLSPFDPGDFARALTGDTDANG